MTSKLVVNTIEADTGISSVSFASSISMNSTAKFHFSDAGIDIGADTNINRPAAGVLGFNINGGEKVRITSVGRIGVGTDNPHSSYRFDIRHSADNVLHLGQGAATLAGMAINSWNAISFQGTNCEFGLYKDGSGNFSYIMGTYQGSTAIPIIFRTGNREERLRISSAGFVGINSAIPRTYLQVSKGSSGYNPGNPTAFNSNNVLACFENSDDVEVTLLSPNNKKNIINFGDNNNVANSSIEYDHSINHLLFKVNGGSERFRINNSGAFGLAGTNYGTAGQVLTSGGTNSVPTWATPSSDFVKISSTTMGGEAAQFELDFDTSTYKYFKIYLTGLNLSSDANLYVRFKVGGTIQTNNAYYGGTIKKYWQGFDSNTYGGQHQNYGYLTHNVGGNDGTYERYSAIFDINCGEAGRGMPFLRHDSFYKDNLGNHANTMGVVGYQNWHILNGIRFYASSGNINHGKFDLYGIK